MSGGRVLGKGRNGQDAVPGSGNSAAVSFAVQVSGPATAATVRVLLYHRFGLAARDSMTVRTSSLRGTGPPPPPHSVAITIDDGHRSVYRDSWPSPAGGSYPTTSFFLQTFSAM